MSDALQMIFTKTKNAVFYVTEELKYVCLCTGKHGSVQKTILTNQICLSLKPAGYRTFNSIYQSSAVRKSIEKLPCSGRF